MVELVLMTLVRTPANALQNSLEAIVKKKYKYVVVILLVMLVKSIIL